MFNQEPGHCTHSATILTDRLQQDPYTEGGNDPGSMSVNLPDQQTVTAPNWVTHTSAVPRPPPTSAEPIQTPIDYHTLDRLLRACLAIPDAKRTLVVERFRHGADIGYRGTYHGRTITNNQSAERRHDGVTAAIAAEVAAGTTRGPFRSPPLRDFVVNPLSARDRAGGGTRLILDLSAPRGSSVNDGIDGEDFRTTVDEAVRLISLLGGRGALLAKLDIRAAFKLIPVRPDQRRLLGFYWDGHFYYQTALSFGSRSSPRIFNDFADCLEALFQQKAHRAVIRKYLDDFWLVCPGNAPADADRAYEAMKQTCAELGVPLATEKCSAPATRMTLLGLELDTDNMTISLPNDKLQALQATIQQLHRRQKCRKKELQSLVGRLVHAARCVPAGRAFSRRLVELANTAAAPLHWLRITAEARADMRWWAAFLPSWNGTAPLMDPRGADGGQPAFHTDSARSGMGAWSGSRWWAVSWPPGFVDAAAPSMTYLEMIPLLVACLVWGPSWRGCRVLVRSDNMGVVGSVARGWSGDSRTMSLLRHLLFAAALQNFSLEVRFVPTHQDGPADALSRGDIARFRRLRPLASQHPDPTPSGLSAYLAAPDAGPEPLTGYRL